MLSGILTAVCLAAFIGIVIWAYSSKQQARFEEASRLPLQDEIDASNESKQQQGEHHG